MRSAIRTSEQIVHAHRATEERSTTKLRQGQRPSQGRQLHGNGSGNAQRNYERYLALAREAALSGDNVEMENCYQHAEHYFRVMKERTRLNAAR